MLASYAVRVEDSRGRRYPEPPHPYRNPFQRDRDRVIHARAFRRLENKTQVFTHRYSDHFRTRLTHTMEVAQISRTIAAALNLNVDLVEALALVHDIGHPPFGHAGERTLRRSASGHRVGPTGPARRRAQQVRRPRSPGSPACAGTPRRARCAPRRTGRPTLGRRRAVAARRGARHPGPDAGTATTGCTTGPPAGRRSRVGPTPARSPARAAGTRRAAVARRPIGRPPPTRGRERRSARRPRPTRSRREPGRPRRTASPPRRPGRTRRPVGRPGRRSRAGRQRW